jgi:hypothetical protein
MRRHSLRSMWGANGRKAEIRSFFVNLGKEQVDLSFLKSLLQCKSSLGHLFISKQTHMTQQERR